MGLLDPFGLDSFPTRDFLDRLFNGEQARGDHRGNSTNNVAKEVSDAILDAHDDSATGFLQDCTSCAMECASIAIVGEDETEIILNLSARKAMWNTEQLIKAGWGERAARQVGKRLSAIGNSYDAVVGLSCLNPCVQRRTDEREYKQRLRNGQTRFEAELGLKNIEKD